ncbi:MAG: outer membrane protein assembly factor BamA [Thermodesulfobacteriota bacterium]
MSISNNKQILLKFLSVLLIILTAFSYVWVNFSFSQEEKVSDTISFNNLEGLKVVDIKISGNKRIEQEVIRLNLKLNSGDSYSADSVRENIKSLYNLGYFEQVTVNVEQVVGGLIVDFIVQEKPVVVDLRISGNDKLKDDKILEAITVKEGKIIDLNQIEESKNAVLAAYAKNGFVGSNVEFEIEPRGEGTVSVLYKISEGNKAFIERVNITGNKGIESKKIKKGLFSKPKNFMSFLTKRGLYNVEEVNRDSDRIRAAYLDEGYIDVKVSQPEVAYNDEIEGYEVVFKIEEGPQFKVSDIIFSGDIISDESELSSVLGLKPNNVFSTFTLQSDIAALTTFYGDKGYAFADVNPDVQLDRSNNTVSIDFQFEKGKEVFIRNIDITGNARTRDKVIRRTLSLREEKPYSSSKFQSAKRQVSRLGFFEDNVEVTTERVPETDDQLDVKINVEERPTGFFSVSGGFSSVETVLLAGQIQESNIFGYGKTLTFNAQIGGVTRVISLNYRDPHFFDSKWTFDSSIFLNDREFRDFDRLSFGGSLGVGRRIYKDLSASVSYRIERQDISDVDRDSRLIITESKRTISSIGIGLTWDSRNNLLDPTSGLLASSNVEFAGIGGNTDFIKYTASARYWLPFWNDTYFSILGLYGFIDLKNNGDDLVVGERFFLGGPNGLRGFAFRRVGPRVPTEDGDFVIIGGVQEVLFSVDYVIPIVKDINLKGVLFLEAGNAFNDGETPNVLDLRPDAGFGVRWISPLGPIRLDFGFPLGNTLPGEDSFEVQFTVGTLF